MNEHFTKMMFKVKDNAKNSSEIQYNNAEVLTKDGVDYLYVTVPVDKVDRFSEDKWYKNTEIALQNFKRQKDKQKNEKLAKDAEKQAKNAQPAEKASIIAEGAEVDFEPVGEGK
jgi:hypothetical protein